MTNELSLAQQLALALQGPNHSQLEPLIAAYEEVKAIVIMDETKRNGEMIDELLYARLSKSVKAFIKKLNDANGR